MNVNRRRWFSFRAGLVGLLTALVFGLVGPVGADAFGDDDGGFESTHGIAVCVEVTEDLFVMVLQDGRSIVWDLYT